MPCDFMVCERKTLAIQNRLKLKTPICLGIPKFLHHETTKRLTKTTVLKGFLG